MKSPAPPKHLSAEARRWWRRLVSEYDITDEAGLLLLLAALEAFDRMRDAQAEIGRDGIVTLDRFGQRKPHPACVIERDARAQMLAALRALNLDLEPVRDAPGRPPGR
ncbi:MAG: hypothetical protein DCC58_05080 [Chloroflexi bacterium]|nr:MAG: hypothetical protein DCC58_05080 [Chloroflexota bacterium]